MSVDELTQEINDLKSRVTVLERRVHRLTNGSQQAVPPPETEGDAKKMIAWMKAEGILSEPPEWTREIAAEWDALPEAEKQAVIDALDNLPPGPMVSDIVIQNRR